MGRSPCSSPGRHHTVSGAVVVRRRKERRSVLAGRALTFQAVFARDAAVEYRWAKYARGTGNPYTPISLRAVRALPERYLVRTTAPTVFPHRHASRLPSFNWAGAEDCAWGSTWRVVESKLLARSIRLKKKVAQQLIPRASSHKPPAKCPAKPREKERGTDRVEKKRDVQKRANVISLAWKKKCAGMCVQLPLLRCSSNALQRPRAFLEGNIPELLVYFDNDGTPSLVLRDCVHPLDSLWKVRHTIQNALRAKAGASTLTQREWKFAKFKPAVIVWLQELLHDFYTFYSSAEHLQYAGEEANIIKYSTRMHRAQAALLRPRILELERQLEMMATLDEYLPRLRFPRNELPCTAQFVKPQPFAPPLHSRWHMPKVCDLRRAIVPVHEAVCAQLQRIIDVAEMKAKAEPEPTKCNALGFKPSASVRRISVAAPRVPPPTECGLTSPAPSFSKAAWSVVMDIRRKKAMQLNDAFAQRANHIRCGGGESSSSAELSPLVQKLLRCGFIYPVLRLQRLHSDEDVDDRDVAGRTFEVECISEAPHSDSLQQEVDMLHRLEYALADGKVPLDGVDGLGQSMVMRACLRRAAGVVRILTRSGADLTVQDWQGQSALHYCVARGLLPCIEAMLSVASSASLKATFSLCDSTGVTAFERAVRMKRFDMVELLMHYGYVCTERDKALLHSYRPIDAAIDEGNFPAVCWWIDAMKLDVNACVGPQSMTLLEQSLTARVSEQVRVPMPHLDGVALKDKPLTDTVTAWLLTRGADPLVCDREGRNALHYAARCNRSHWIAPFIGEVERRMAKQPPTAVVNFQDADGNTPLHALLESIHSIELPEVAAAASSLLQSSVYVRSCPMHLSNIHGFTVLHSALAARAASVVESLVGQLVLQAVQSEVVDKVLLKANDLGDTPIGCAIRSNFALGVELLISPPILTKHSLTVRQSLGRLPLLMAVDCLGAAEHFSRTRYVDPQDERPNCDARKSRNVIHSILTYSTASEINEPSGPAAETALHSACRHCLWYAASQLLARGAMSHLPNAAEETPLSIATANTQDTSVVRLLIANYQKNRGSDDLLVEVAASAGAASKTPYVVESLFDRVPIDLAGTPLGESLCLAAAKAGNAKLIQSLLDHGATRFDNGSKPEEEQSPTYWLLSQASSHARMLLTKNSLSLRAATPSGRRLPLSSCRDQSQIHIRSIEAAVIALLRRGFFATAACFYLALECRMDELPFVLLHEHEHEVDINWQAPQTGKRPVHICAADAAGAAMMHELCEKPTLLASCLDRSGSTPLRYAVAADKPLLVAMLLSTGQYAKSAAICPPRAFSYPLKPGTRSSRTGRTTQWLMERAAWTFAEICTAAVCDERLDVLRVLEQCGRFHQAVSTAVPSLSRLAPTHKYKVAKTALDCAATSAHVDVQAVVQVLPSCELHQRTRVMSFALLAGNLDLACKIHVDLASEMVRYTDIEVASAPLLESLFVTPGFFALEGLSKLPLATCRDGLSKLASASIALAASTDAEIGHADVSLCCAAFLHLLTQRIHCKIYRFQSRYPSADSVLAEYLRSELRARGAISIGSDVCSMMLRLDMKQTLSLVIENVVTKSIFCPLSSCFGDRTSSSVPRNLKPSKSPFLAALGRTSVNDGVLRGAIDCMRDEHNSVRAHTAWWSEALLSLSMTQQSKLRLPVGIRAQFPCVCLMRDIAKNDPFTDTFNSQQPSAAHVCIQKHRSSVLDYALASAAPDLDVNCHDSMGRTPLIVAAIAGDVDSTSSLLSLGVDVMVEDNCGLTALHHAAKRGYTAIAEGILADDAGCDAVCAASSRPEASYAFVQAVRCGKDSCAMALLSSLAAENCPREVPQFPPAAETPLHWAASTGCMQALEYLLQKCSRKYLNLVTIDGFTARDYAPRGSGADAKLASVGVERHVWYDLRLGRVPFAYTTRDVLFHQNVASHFFNIDAAVKRLLPTGDDDAAQSTFDINETAWNHARMGRDKELLTLLKLGETDFQRLRILNLPEPIPTGAKELGHLGKEVAASLYRFGGVHGGVEIVQPHPRDAQDEEASDEEEQLLRKPYALLTAAEESQIPSILACENLVVLKKVVRAVRDLPRGPTYRTDSHAGTSSVLHWACRKNCRDSIRFVLENNAPGGIISKLLCELLGAQYDECGLTCFHHAVLARCWGIVSDFVKYGIPSTPDKFSGVRPLEMLPSPIALFGTKWNISFGDAAAGTRTYFEEASMNQCSRLHAGDVAALFFGNAMEPETLPIQRGVRSAQSTQARVRREVIMCDLKDAPAQRISEMVDEQIATVLQKWAAHGLEKCFASRHPNASVELVHTLAQAAVNAMRKGQLAVTVDVEAAESREVQEDRFHFKAMFRFAPAGSAFGRLILGGLEELMQSYGVFGWLCLSKIERIAVKCAAAPDGANGPHANISRHIRESVDPPGTYGAVDVDVSVFAGTTNLFAPDLQQLLLSYFYAMSVVTTVQMQSQIDRISSRLSRSASSLAAAAEAPRGTMNNFAIYIVDSVIPYFSRLLAALHQRQYIATGTSDNDRCADGILAELQTLRKRQQESTESSDFTTYSDDAITQHLTIVSQGLERLQSFALDLGPRVPLHSTSRHQKEPRFQRIQLLHHCYYVPKTCKISVIALAPDCSEADKAALEDAIPVYEYNGLREVYRLRRQRSADLPPLSGLELLWHSRRGLTKETSVVLLFPIRFAESEAERQLGYWRAPQTGELRLFYGNNIDFRQWRKYAWGPLSACGGLGRLLGVHSAFADMRINEPANHHPQEETKKPPRALSSRQVKFVEAVDSNRTVPGAQDGEEYGMPLTAVDQCCRSFDSAVSESPWGRTTALLKKAWRKASKQQIRDADTSNVKRHRRSHHKHSSVGVEGDERSFIQAERLGPLLLHVYRFLQNDRKFCSLSRVCRSWYIAVHLCQERISGIRQDCIRETNAAISAAFERCRKERSAGRRVPIGAVTAVRDWLCCETCDDVEAAFSEFLKTPMDVFLKVCYVRGAQDACSPPLIPRLTEDAIIAKRRPKARLHPVQLIRVYFEAAYHYQHFLYSANHVTATLEQMYGSKKEEK